MVNFQRSIKLVTDMRKEHEVELLYDRISNLSIQPLVLEHDSASYARELCVQIGGFLQPSAEAVELRQLLESQEIEV
ncbi:unnamed protein product [Brugia timori]|uniref:DUF2007 domain-containing protein n=1 Tax=Brugia timori TaxID=42155 RepID=A0A0R3Q5Z0_9BILA|nr:unnamed protein product [Brugia timori]